MLKQRVRFVLIFGLMVMTASARAQAPPTIATNVMVWVSSGTNILNLQPLPSADQSWQIKGVGDVFGIGSAQIIWLNQDSGQVVAWMLNASGQLVNAQYLTSSIPPELLEPGIKWDIVGVGDVTGDGKADLIWRAH